MSRCWSSRGFAAASSPPSPSARESACATKCRAATKHHDWRPREASRLAAKANERPAPAWCGRLARGARICEAARRRRGARVGVHPVHGPHVPPAAPVSRGTSATWDRVRATGTAVGRALGDIAPPPDLRSEPLLPPVQALHGQRRPNTVSAPGSLRLPAVDRCRRAGPRWDRLRAWARSEKVVADCARGRGGQLRAPRTGTDRARIGDHRHRNLRSHRHRGGRESRPALVMRWHFGLGCAFSALPRRVLGDGPVAGSAYTETTRRPATRRVDIAGTVLSTRSAWRRGGRWSGYS